MANPAPPIDKRTEKEIAEQVQALLAAYDVPNGSATYPLGGEIQGVGSALVNIFARYAALTIQRINQAPDKNFLAFLDLLGAALMPPEPARVPLTFFLAAGSAADAVVPAGTQAAAPPAAAEGEKEPVIFETERELRVTAARLASLWVRDPEKDQFADLSAILAAPGGAGLPAFQGQRPLEHLLYIGDDELLSFPSIGQMNLIFGLHEDLPESSDARVVQWETWNGARWVAVSTSDETSNLTQSGTVTITGLAGSPRQTIRSLASRWLRARLVTPVSLSAEPRAGMVRASQLPTISTLSLQGVVNRSNLPIEQAFANVLPIEISKDFFPFGEKPKFGDALYLANAEAFAQAGATVTLHVTLTSPASNGIVPRTDGGATLAWEYWNGSAWALLGTSNTAGVVTGQVTVDGTKAFTSSAATPAVLDGIVRFTFPSSPPAPVTINGMTSYWIRVRLSAGNYGVEARYVRDTTQQSGYRFDEATFKPPSVSRVTADYSLTKNVLPDAVLTTNDFETIAQAGPFAPFRADLDTQPALYLGFMLPGNRAQFPNAPLSLYFRMAEQRYGERTEPISPERSTQFGGAGANSVHTFDVVNPASLPVELTAEVFGTRWQGTCNPAGLSLAPGASEQVQVEVAIPSDAAAGAGDRGWLRLAAADGPAYGLNAEIVTWCGSDAPAAPPPRLAWEYWNGAGWGKLLVVDETDALAHSGLVEFLPPANFVPSTEFGLSQYWLRVRWTSGDYKTLPKLRAVLLNTTTAVQTLTLQNEVLGSSNGSGGQVFRAARAPVLRNQQLHVREPDLPPAGEREALEAEEGEDVISTIVDAAGRPREIWVRWHQVSDFYGSGPRDRHYVLDHLTGEVRFGDGQSGLIPPVGSGNIRMTRYQTGGGARGNRAAATISQLKTTVPYVDRVANFEAASAGADAETLDSLVARAPRTIRHRNRAVTVEDYQDLALLASPEVARARCVPLFDLAVDPDAAQQRPGTVSLVIVPRSSAAKPLASLELLDRVQSYLDAHRLASCDLVVVGPDYVRVDVEVQVALKSLEVAGQVEAAVTEALRTFLHPLTGGSDGAGWDFGRQPHESDVYALLEPIAGVDHVHGLHLTVAPDRPGAEHTDRFLVYAGRITTSLIYDEA